MVTRLLVLAALVFAVPAGANDGFRVSTRLSPIVAAISGKPVPVYCPRTSGAWADLMETVGLPVTSTGYVPHTDDAVYVNTAVCQRLEGWIRGKNVPTLEHLGWSVLTLTHESMHVYGLDDEGETDCAALSKLPAVLRSHFKVRKAATIKVAVAAAWRKHRLSGPAYQGNCGT